jgi:hypothetical protein
LYNEYKVQILTLIGRSPVFGDLVVLDFTSICSGTQFTCFTGTKVQILTEHLRRPVREAADYSIHHARALVVARPQLENARYGVFDPNLPPPHQFLASNRSNYFRV